MDLTQALANYDNPWLATLLAAVIGISLALVIHMLASVGVRGIVRLSPLFQALFRCIRQPTRMVFVLFALQFVWSAAPDDLRLLSAVTRVTGLLMIAALTWLGVRAVSTVSDSVSAVFAFAVPAFALAGNGQAAISNTSPSYAQGNNGQDVTSSRHSAASDTRGSSADTAMPSNNSLSNDRNLDDLWRRLDTNNDSQAVRGPRVTAVPRIAR